MRVASRLATAVAAVAALPAALAGCGGTDRGTEGPVTVYVSAPLRGTSGPHGRAIRDGAKLALRDAGGRAGGVRVKAVYLDDTEGPGERARWSPGAVAANARRAAEDSSSIAYIGELESGATRASLPITNEAMILHVSPGSTATDLVRDAPGSNDVPELLQPSGERTFGRVIPDDEAQAGAGAAWARKLGARSVRVVSGGSAFAGSVASEFAEEASALGIAVDERGERPASCPGPRPIYLAGEPDRVARFLVPGTRSGELVIATDAFLSPPALALEPVARCQAALRVTSSAQDPSQLPPAGQRFARDYRGAFARDPDPYAAYGYEAMAVVLDSIERAEGAEDRSAVVDAFLATDDRRSVLGTYSIDFVGNTTLDRLAGYRIAGGSPVFDAPLRAP